MIHTTQQGTPKRRIAVVQVPRPQRARMGSIGPGFAGSSSAGGSRVAWTTISDAPPDSSQNWLSLKLREQARARETTPGSLAYTPASSTPRQNTPPWNSWSMPNCGPFNEPPPAEQPAAAPPDKKEKLWLAIGLLGAAASLTYLMSRATDRR